MVDYDFYANSYLGTELTPRNFSNMAERAQAMLERFGRVYRVVSSGEIARKMAICAMAECIARHQRRAGITNASIGSVRVSYDDGQGKTLVRELLECAGIYLDIYRGVG